MKIKMFAACSLLGAAVQIGWLFAPDSYSSLFNAEEKPAAGQKEVLKKQVETSSKNAKAKDGQTTIIEGSSTYFHQSQ